MNGVRAGMAFAQRECIIRSLQYKCLDEYTVVLWHMSTQVHLYNVHLITHIYSTAVDILTSFQFLLLLQSTGVVEVIDSILDEVNTAAFEDLQTAGHSVLDNAERYALYVANALSTNASEERILLARDNIGEDMVSCS